MARPRRLYYDEDKKKYFYIIKNKRKYIKKPKGLSDNKLININIKNIVGDQVRKKKRRKKRIIKVQKKIDSDMSKGQTGSLPIYLFKQKQEFPTIESIVNNEKKDNEKVLEKLITQITQPLQQGPTLALPAGSPRRPAGPPPSQKRPTRSVEIKEEGSEDLPGEVKELTQFSSDTLNDLKVLGIKPDSNIKNKDNKSKVNSQIKEKNEEVYDIWRTEKNKTNFPRDDAKWTETISELANIKRREGARESKGDMEGSGKDDGLFNDEISKILKSKVKDFIPVIPSDKVEDMLRYVKQGDKRFGFVVNTNPSTSDGSGKDGMRPGHWRAVYIDNENPDFESAEYFDPLAEGIPEKSLLSVMKKISQKMNPEKMFKVKVNSLKRQADNTGTCGYHCIDFLNKRYNGEDWVDATGYNSYIEKTKPDDSHQGEKEIDKKIKKFNSYL
jgi:hypothetical protein